MFGSSPVHSSSLLFSINDGLHQGFHGTTETSERAYKTRIYREAVNYDVFLPFLPESQNSGSLEAFK